MRCWLSAAQAAYHSFPSLPPTKTRSLRCTAFFPPKPLRWVSAGALLGAVIKAPVLHFFGTSVWGWYHYPRRALHTVETLDARGSRRRIRRFYAVSEFAPCGQNIPSAGTHATPAPNRAHSGLHAETGAFRTGPLSLPSTRTARSRTSPGRVSERQTLPLLRLDPVCSRRTQRAFGTAMRLCASLFRGVAAPLGCVICLQFGDVAVFSLCAQYFLNVRGRGVLLPSACFTCC